MNEEYLDFAKEIAYEAGKVILKYYYQDNRSSYKADKTIVTLADIEINDYLIKRVKEKYTDHCVIGEEASYGNSDYAWVCDPVDGTLMYSMHIPIPVFSLALVINGIPELGVVYDPFTNSMYSAIKGKGAYKNNDRISVSNLNIDDMKSVSHYDAWPKCHYDIHSVINDLEKKALFVKLGSVARACMAVATGDFTMAIFPGRKGKNCDIAAAKVIVEEAGGKVTNLFGEEQRYDKSIKGALISNGIIHDEIVSIIKKYIKDE